MKDLIIIGAHCPDKERKNLLNKCIDSLFPLKNDFDILVCSHTEIPSYIIDKIDYFFYDKNNELIYDLNYINQPWFSPFEGNTIYSTYTTGYSTYLAAYRLFIGGFGLAKTLGYNKIHWIEYDSLINDYSEIYNNNTLLNEYGSIVYKKEYKNFENNLSYPNGSFMSINLSKLDKTFLEYNKNKLLSLIENSYSKTNEKVTEDILTKNNSQLVKDFNILKKKGIITGLSSFTKKDDLNDWIVPYYDTKTGKLNVIVWNSKKDYPINTSFIINQEKIITINNINKYQWSIREVDDINNVNEILIIVDNKIKNHILINTPELKEKFKRNNQTQYN